jgi:hypothetical protein
MVSEAVMEHLCEMVVDRKLLERMNEVNVINHQMLVKLLEMLVKLLEMLVKLMEMLIFRPKKLL